MTQPAASTSTTPTSEPEILRVTREEFLAVQVGDLVLYDNLDPNARRRMWVLRLSEERGDIVAYQNGDPADMPISSMRWDVANPRLPGFLWHDALLGVGAGGSLTLVATGVHSSGAPVDFHRAVEIGTSETLAERVKVTWPAETPATTAPEFNITAELMTGLPI